MESGGEDSCRFLFHIIYLQRIVLQMHFQFSCFKLNE